MNDDVEVLPTKPQFNTFDLTQFNDTIWTKIKKTSFQKNQLYLQIQIDLVSSFQLVSKLCNKNINFFHFRTLFINYIQYFTEVYHFRAEMSTNFGNIHQKAVNYCITLCIEISLC